MMDASVTAMNEMHKQMTKNLEPALKEQIDKMHKQCTKNMKSGEGQSHMSRMGMM